MTHPAELKSTIVRPIDLHHQAALRLAEHLAPGLAARVAARLWFTRPAVPSVRPLPPGGEAFTVTSQRGAVRGTRWGDGSPVYLVHGWGGVGGQFAAFVPPLLTAGHRVVMFDAPSHGGSDSGPSGPQQSNALEFGRALDDVAARFGPAHTVIGHSLGALSTLLALRYGWLGTDRLVLVAPMLSVDTAIEVFSSALALGPRTRASLTRRVESRVGEPLSVFAADALLDDELPTLVVHDAGDRQAPYAESRRYVERHPAATLLTTTGLGHHRVLRDPGVVAAVMDQVSGRSEPTADASQPAAADLSDPELAIAG